MTELFVKEVKIGATDTLPPEAILQNRKKIYDIAKGTFAGAVGGLNIALIGHPFDTLKVRLQTQPQHAPIYNGVIDCLRKTIQWEGVRGLFAGLAPPVIGQILFRSSLFLSHSETKSFLRDRNGELTNTHLMLAGAVGWGIGAFIECPFDVIKSHLQVQIVNLKTIPNYTPRYTNMAGCAAVIWRTRGMRGMYQGFSSHLLRNLPAGAIQLGLYDYLRIRWASQQQVPVSQLPIAQSLLAGSIAGVSFWTAVYPLDVIKSTMQADSIDPANRKYRNTLHCAASLWKDGWRNLFRGYIPCVLRAVPANAVMLYSVALIMEKF